MREGEIGSWPSFGRCLGVGVVGVGTIGKKVPLVGCIGAWDSLRGVNGRGGRFAEYGVGFGVELGHIAIVAGDGFVSDDAILVDS